MGSEMCIRDSSGAASYSLSRLGKPAALEGVADEMDSTVLNSCRVGQFHLGTSRCMHPVSFACHPRSLRNACARACVCVRGAEELAQGPPRNAHTMTAGALLPVGYTKQSIRTRKLPLLVPVLLAAAAPQPSSADSMMEPPLAHELDIPRPVSYTHLTLPTIHLV